MNYRQVDDAVVHYAYGRLIDTFSDKRVREQAAQDLGQHVSRLLPSLSFRTGAIGAEAADRFAADGVHCFDPFLSRQQCIEVLRHLSAIPVFDNQSHHDSSGRPYAFETACNTFPVASYRVADILHTPHLLEAMLSPQILELAERYLGCVPTMYGTNLYWSFPGHEPVRGVQHYHRDFDDLKFVTLFILVNDVDSEGGAHDFIPGTHLRDVNLRCFQEWQHAAPASPAEGDLHARFRDPQILFAMNPWIDPLIESVFASRIQRLAGPAGARAHSSRPARTTRRARS